MSEEADSERSSRYESSAEFSGGHGDGGAGQSAWRRSGTSRSVEARPLHMWPAERLNPHEGRAWERAGAAERPSQAVLPRLTGVVQLCRLQNQNGPTTPLRLSRTEIEPRDRPAFISWRSSVRDRPALYADKVRVDQSRLGRNSEQTKGSTSRGRLVNLDL
jgi:hypothetical protein